MKNLPWRILTVKPHWAWATIYGPKRIENRTWLTPYRGLILIHSSSRRPPRRMADASQPGEGRNLARVGMPPIDDLICGAIIGAIELYDICTLDQLWNWSHWRQARFNQGAWASGPLCWLLREPVALPPFIMPGKLNLYSGKLPENVDRTYRKLLGM